MRSPLATQHGTEKRGRKGRGKPCGPMAAFTEWTSEPDYIDLELLPVQDVPAMNLLLQIVGLAKS
jgi:hypothetical protein